MAEYSGDPRAYAPDERDGGDPIGRASGIDVSIAVRRAADGSVEILVTLPRPRS